MARKPKNPVDPATGRPRRGRPPKAKPLQGSQPVEKSPSTILEADEAELVPVGPATVQSVDPSEDIRNSSELARMWKERFRGAGMMEIPPELTAKYPDGYFAWSRDTKECLSKYRTQYGYEPVEAAKPLPGQTDSCFRFGDAILMVRPRWMKKLHDQSRREAVLSQHGNTPAARAAEEESRREAKRAGYDLRSRNISYFDEAIEANDPEVEEKALREADMRRSGRTRLASGTKYVSGGIPS